MFKHIVADEEELRSLLGYPNELVRSKAISHLDDHCRAFIAKSPFLLLATSDGSGHCDVSPRGDAPGFVQVLDEKHLFIPERPGNRRIDSMRNILSNPHVGLIFIIPGLEETLRVNGRACIVRDKELLTRSEVQGKVPLAGIGVIVEECYAHCAKAFKRSGLWNPQSWLPKESLPNVPAMIAAHVKLPGVDAEKVREALKDSYTNRLY